MKTKIEIDTSELVERKTDDRGRITLGLELANKNVEVAIIDVEDSEE